MADKEKDLRPFQKNMFESQLAIEKLKKAGYEVGGSVAGVSVYKVTEKTLKNGHIVRTLEPIWRGQRYPDAVKELIDSNKNKPKAKAVPKRVVKTAKPKAKDKKK